MGKTKRGWHSPVKHIEQSTESKCPHCKKHVQSLEAHMGDRHKGKKMPKKIII